MHCFLLLFLVARTQNLEARGVSMGSVTWGDVVVKILAHNAHMPMNDHVSYAGERIRWSPRALPHFQCHFARLHSVEVFDCFYKLYLDMSFTVRSPKRFNFRFVRVYSFHRR